MSSEAPSAIDRIDHSDSTGGIRSVFTRFTLGKAYATLLSAQLLVVLAMWVFLWPRAVGVDLTGANLTGAVVGLLAIAAAGFYVSLYRLFVGMPRSEAA